MRRRFLTGIMAVVGSFALAAAPPTAPNIVTVWPAGLFEVRLEFDAPVAPELAKSLVGLPIEFDAAPPGQARTTGRESDSKGTLRVAAARPEHGGRTLVLTTDPHPRASVYRLRLPAGSARPEPLTYDLTGVEAVWDEGGNDPSPVWTLRWPGFDPSEAAATLAKSADHAQGFADRPQGTAHAHVAARPSHRRGDRAGPRRHRRRGDARGRSALGADAEADARKGSARFRVDSTGEPLLLSVTVATGGANPPKVRVTYQKTEDARATPIDPSRLFLPWATVPTANPATASAPVPDLSGGDPKRGALVFAGAEAKCANCHKVRGVGGVVGPDLSGLVGRDRAEVYLDVVNPSARIHPDFVSYTVAKKDGKVLVGTVRAEGADAIRVTDSEAKTTVVPRAEVEDVRPSATSVMPVGLAGAIGEANLRDLIAFLTTDTPPAPAGR